MDHFIGGSKEKDPRGANFGDSQQRRARKEAGTDHALPIAAEVGHMATTSSHAAGKGTFEQERGSSQDRENFRAALGAVLRWE